MVIDIGTGSGQAVLRRARREPASLVIGIDAAAVAMADASRRAAANVRKGGVPNAIFLAESVERLPGLLAGRADLATVVLPWGSLLRGLVEPRDDVLAALRGLLHAKGELVAMLADMELAQVERLEQSYAAAGLETVEIRPVTAADVTQLSSGWARRLGIPGSRPAWIIRLRRQDRADGRR